MDEHSIERIRQAEFPLSVRGYDRNEVDRFLAELADWLETGGGEQAAGVEAVRLELERIGEHTATILTEAHAAAQAIRDDASNQVRQQLVDANLTAESLRAEAGEYAGDTRDEADAYARKSRAEADAYAERMRSEADDEFGELRETAQKEGQRVVAEANRRKADIESVISDLEQRRDAVLAELERLASGIAGTATEHRGPKAAEPSGEGADTGDEIDDTDETTVLSRDAT
ncbi:MAG: DivIVA protein [Solirubrobacterales bacterium]|nr:DivIVA protein [Solirubrobacterales bacterium]